ncbi:MAG: hypothetical protein ACPG2Y_01850, partial [Acholeplasmataceae bacterium]
SNTIDYNQSISNVLSIQENQRYQQQLDRFVYDSDGNDSDFPSLDIDSSDDEWEACFRDDLREHEMDFNINSIQST